MPPTGYLTEQGIGSCLEYLASTFPSICQLLILPATSAEGRTCRAIKIAKGSGADRHGVLFISGVHARELVPPDLLVSLALKLCQAYTSGTGLAFGNKAYDALTVKLTIEALDLFILPLVNPDGRAYVQSPSGDPWWRKNRSASSGLPCKGVDLNRNYDFLWSSGIGTSSNSCSDVFHGTAAFSEPETRNVRHLLDTYSNICCMIDVHSFSQLILHPWGDDETQTTDPAMNFANPAYNDLRGTVGDTAYKEYMPPEDLKWLATAGTNMRDAIQEVRGTVYKVEPGVLLYPTSGVSKDYAFGRHLVNTSKRRVYAYTVETGLEFQPPYAEALSVISEVSAGLIQFCLSSLCVVEETVSGTDLAAALDDMRAFRDREMLRMVAGRRYDQELVKHSAELLQIIMGDPQLRKQTVGVLRHVYEVVRSRNDPKPKVFEASIVEEARNLADKFAKKASPALRTSIAELRREVKYFRGKTVAQALKSASSGKIPRQLNESNHHQ